MSTVMDAKVWTKTVDNGIGKCIKDFSNVDVLKGVYMRALVKALVATLVVVMPIATPLDGGQPKESMETQNHTSGVPRAVITETVYQAGDIQQGNPIIHDFIIKNGGDAPLTIKAQPC